MKRYIYIALAILLFSSCAVKYQQPDVQKEALIRDAAPADTTFDISTLCWRDFYSDPILRSLIDSALTGNLDLQIAVNRIEQATSLYKQSKSALFPTLGASASGGYVRSDLGASDSPYFSLGLNTSWEIDIWGRLSSAKRSKYQSLLAQESTKNAIITSLVANIATGYYTLVTLDTEKKFILDAIQNREDYLSTVKDLKEAAQVNEIAVLQAEAQLMTAKAYIPDIDKAIYQVENAICALLGIPPSPVERQEVKDLFEITLTNLDEVGIPANLLRNRPDVLASEYELKSALESFNSAKAAMYPALTLTGNVSSDAVNIANWFAMPASLVYGIIGGLTQPIFNGRALRTNKEVAYKEFEAAEKSFKSTVLSAGTEVSNSIFALRSDKEKAEYLKKQYIALDKAYEYSVELLVNGYATYLDVLSAQEGMFNAEISLIQGVQNCLNDQIELYRALGGGWGSSKRNPYHLDIVETLDQYHKSIKEDPDNELVDLEELIPGIAMDIKYADTANFTHTKIYSSPKAFLRRPVAEALLRAQQQLAQEGLGFKILDAYRPYEATLYFYEVCKDTNFVADPRHGSIHNRGCAVDLTLIDLATGEELPMPTSFDCFTQEAWHTYTNLPDDVLQSRKKLLDIMTANGFNMLKSEWWHYNYSERDKYKLMNISFEEMKK